MFARQTNNHRLSVNIAFDHSATEHAQIIAVEVKIGTPNTFSVAF